MRLPLAQGPEGSFACCARLMPCAWHHGKRGIALCSACARHEKVSAIERRRVSAGQDIDRRGITPDVRSLPSPADAAKQADKCVVRSAA